MITHVVARFYLNPKKVVKEGKKSLYLRLTVNSEWCEISLRKLWIAKFISAHGRYHPVKPYTGQFANPLKGSPGAVSISAVDPLLQAAGKLLVPEREVLLRQLLTQFSCIGQEQVVRSCEEGDRP
jgi:hypothetical protein